ncbi:hypothetical protein KM043_009795 [Ampulex compressa]|nr:hypothetical protein KM043_009795 [Ampulex compressa]
MFRDGQYLEVIKASNNCLATAIVTVQEKTVEIKKKRVSTNKWLDVEDWAALYKILERALIRNNRNESRHGDEQKSEWIKSTRQLEVTYRFEPPDDLQDSGSLPTIRVNVSPVKKKVSKDDTSDRPIEKKKRELQRNTSERIKTGDLSRVAESESELKALVTQQVPGKKSTESKKDKSHRHLKSENSRNNTLEEYVPGVLTAKRICPDLNYIPSRKSILESMQLPSNEYTPTFSSADGLTDNIEYIPNSAKSTEIASQAYEPALMLPVKLSEEYIPNSKNIKASVEKYQPDFTSKSMKFNDSYVPSSVDFINRSLKRSTEKTKRLKTHGFSLRQKGTSSKKRTDPFL